MAEIQNIIELTFTEADGSAFAASALESANNAAESATNAFRHASAASDSAEESAESARLSNQFAVNAYDRASAALRAKEGAETAAQQAETSATNAATYEQNAFANAQDAQFQANRAATASQTAVRNASDAAGYAANASSAANNASNSATSAASSATQATSAKDTVVASVTEVAGYASSADSSATQAAQSASTAQTQAQNAMTHASNAQTFANNAQTSATQAAGYATTANDSANLAIEVADSIPDDYTTLSNDVDDLKTAFEQLPTSIQPDMSVGNVFSDDSYTEDKTPYLYRVSGGGVEVGKVEADKIVGGTVAWNQLLYNTTRTQTGYGVTLTFDATTRRMTTVGTATSTAYASISNQISTIANHIYAIICGNFTVGKYAFAGSAMGDIYGSTIKKATSSASCTGQLRLIEGETYNYDMPFQVHDLTQMFGSAVADMIYAMETANAGSGVAFFRSMFPNDYYPYNAGELMHVSGLQSHDMVGFNQWDEEWELGGISNSGNNYPNTDRIRSKNYIPVIAGATYYYWIGTPTYGIWTWGYDADKNYVGRIPSTEYALRNQTVTIPNNVHYIRFVCQQGYGTTYKNDICINLSWDGQRNGEYEPYEVHSYPLDSTLTLRGIPKVADGKMYYDGDIYSADGKVQRRIGIFDLGDLDYTYSDNNGRSFFTAYVNSIPNIKRPVSNAYALNGFVGGYKIVPINATLADKDIACDGHAGSSSNRFIVVDNAYTDAATFKSAISGVYLVYELATPTEETAEPYTEYQKVFKGGTEEYVSTGIVPVGHITKYPTDIVSKVDGLPSDFSTLIAPTEKGFTATRNYTVNDLLIVNNILYKVTANIANGATITVGTNVQQTTLSALIKALSA